MNSICSIVLPSCVFFAPAALNLMFRLCPLAANLFFIQTFSCPAIYSSIHVLEVSLALRSELFIPLLFLSSVHLFLFTTRNPQNISVTQRIRVTSMTKGPTNHVHSKNSVHLKKTRSSDLKSSHALKVLVFLTSGTGAPVLMSTTRAS